MSTLKTSATLDRVGITASTLCAIHCALLPIFLTTLPLIGMEFLAEEWVELSMILLSVVLGVSALTISYRNQHRKPLPFLVLIAGFTLIAAGHFSGIDRLEPVLIPIGGLMVAGAHLLNWRLNKVCSQPHIK